MNRMPESEKKHRDYTGAKMGMWLFLFTELCLFFGPLLLYAVFRFKYPAEFHAASTNLNLRLGALNTVILITSSLTVALAISAMQRGSKKITVYLLMITIVLGSLFLVNKYFEWAGKIGHGIYPNSPELLNMPRGEIIFYGLYYVATGLHGLHVLIGASVLAVIAVWVMQDKITQKDYVKLENSGLYWHLVDIIWIFLFPFFYLIR